MPAVNARNHVLLTAEVAASPDAVFTYFTDNFFELWPGKAKVLKPGDDPNEPNGLGLERWMKPPGSAALEERIITHDRPELIEYVVTNDTQIHNHLGRIAFTPTATGTSVRYTIDFDYKPAALGPLVRAILSSTWALRSRRKLRAAFPG